MRAGSRITLAYIRKRATENMRSTCRIERVNPPTWDEETGLATAGSRTTVYEGVCRIWEASGTGGVVQVGEEDLPLQMTQLSIPWNTPNVPRRDDEVLITGSSSDDEVITQRYRILDVAKAGDLRPTRRFTVQRVHSGAWS